MGPCPRSGPGGGEGCSLGPPSPGLRPCIGVHVSISESSRKHHKHVPVLTVTAHYLAKASGTTEGLHLDGEMGFIPDKVLHLLGCSSCFHSPRPSLACWRGMRSHLQHWKEGCGANPLHCRMPVNVKQVQVHLGISAAPLTLCYSRI